MIPLPERFAEEPSRRAETLPGQGEPLTAEPGEWLEQVARQDAKGRLPAVPG